MILKNLKFRNLKLLEFPPDEGGGSGDEGGGGVGLPPGGGGDPPPSGGGGTTPPSGSFLPSITISPNTTQHVAVETQRCFTAIASISVAQEDERLAAFDPEVVNGCDVYDASVGYWRKQCGGNSIYDAYTSVPQLIYHSQPFYIVGANSEFNTPGVPNNNTSCYIGVQGTGGWDFMWEVFAYCNTTVTGSCTVTWFGNCRVRNPSNVVTDIALVGVNFNENFRVRSDGTTIYWEKSTAGVWSVAATYANPTDGGDYQFFVDALFLQNTWTNVRTFRGSWQGQVPVTWTVPDGGTLTGTGNTRCFSAPTAGDYSICVEAEGLEPLCIDIVVEPLYFTPVGYECGECAFAGATISFTSNASGVLTADGGTVITGTQWRAPDVAGTYTLTYTVGEAVETCELNIIEPLTVANVTESTLVLLPGQVLTLDANYDYPNVEWTIVGCGDDIVTETGILTIPYAPNNDCFGAYSCSITGTLVSTGTACPVPIGAGSTVTIPIKVNPVFPSRSVCGPPHIKWLRQTAEFKVIKTEFEGGCDEKHIRNRVPTYKWTINYRGLPYSLGEECNTVVTPLGCDASTGTAKKLDDFYFGVAGEYGYFTLIDEETGETWQNVSFERPLDKDHVNRYTNQSRTAYLVWKPCCNLSPLGGACVIHGGQYQLDTPDEFTLDSEGDEFTASWDEVDMATSYVLELSLPIGGEVIDQLFVIDSGVQVVDGGIFVIDS